MAKYIQRTSAPTKDDLNYIHWEKGGFNYCIRISGNSCLPNCVGYAWGRWRELLGKYHKLARTNAENWWGNTADGYERGQTPKLGAVICWRKGVAGNSSDGAGHVAIVEHINADGSILISQSAYGGARFTTKTLQPPYNFGSGYVLQGFIYTPVDFTGKTVEEIAREVVAGVHGNGTQRKKAIEALGYNYAEVQAEVNRILGAMPVSSSLNIGDKVKVTSDATYYDGKKIPAWVKALPLYVRSVSGDRVVISVLKSGAVTGAVHRQYLKKI